jgi:predicted MFS family arabinose efflux permease
MLELNLQYCCNIVLTDKSSHHLWAKSHTLRGKKILTFPLLQNLFNLGMVVGPAIGGAVSTHLGEQESFIFCTNLFCCARRLFEDV